MTQGILLAQQFIDLVRTKGIQISKGFVFGSWIKGIATEDSDIDVCLVSPSFGKDYIQEMIDLRKIALTIDSRIEPIPLTPTDFADPLSTLSSEINKYAYTLK